MRWIVGCLAMIGLAVLLLVGGCIGLVGYGIASIPALPPHATPEAISRRYHADIAVITAAIARGDPIPPLTHRLSSAVAAIQHQDGEFLGRHQIVGSSSWRSNRAGTGSLTTTGGILRCVVLEMPASAGDYLVFFIDDQPAAVEPP
jgi:hypothetical protein